MLRKQGRELFFDAAVAAGWAIYATLFLIRALRTGSVVDLGLLLFFTFLAALFLMRHPARECGTSWETLLAVVGTFLPAVGLSPAPGGHRWLGESIQILSLAGMMAAVISLGRSFGIAPADRGLQTAGLYRWLRHPLYSAELWFYVGYLVVNPSRRNVMVLTVSAVIQLLRIQREERILAGYPRYAAQVRWRLVPFVW